MKKLSSFKKVPYVRCILSKKESEQSEDESKLNVEEVSSSEESKSSRYF